MATNKPKLSTKLEKATLVIGGYDFFLSVETGFIFRYLIILTSLLQLSPVSYNSTNLNFIA